jgi:drug/metabolite transporter (DMT)-like permease
LGPALLALCASLTWGLGDYLGGLKARVLPTLTVLAASQPFGLAALGIAVAVRGTGIPGGEVAWSTLAAAISTVGLFAFYRGLAVGAMSVVAPIAAVSAGIPVIWGVAVSGDHISGLQAIGFVAAVGGSVAASVELHPERRKVAAGVGWAALAMLAFGTYYIPMHTAANHDWLWPAFLFRCTSVTIVVTLALARGLVRPGALRAHWPALVAVGVLDTGGNALFAAASSAHGLLSVVSVLASLYPVVTVLLARIVLGERVERTQDAGVLVALVGVVLITAGG